MSYAAEIIEYVGEEENGRMCSKRDLIAWTCEMVVKQMEGKARAYRSLRTVRLSSPFRGKSFDSIERIENRIWRKKKDVIKINYCWQEQIESDGGTRLETLLKPHHHRRQNSLAPQSFSNVRKIANRFIIYRWMSAVRAVEVVSLWRC